MKKNIPLHIYISFSVSIFLGAFLLFQVQPIIGKYILPWFGGASAVWITAMLFFQMLLLAGYFYVFVLSFLSFKKQIIAHSIFLFVTVFGVFSFLRDSQIPIMPDVVLKSSFNSPILQVLQILFISVGLTYFILSTTSILLQKWFGTAYQGKSPYIFYSLSNTASLAALVSYPFFVEPFFQLRTQGIGWSAGFIVYTVFLFICCLQMFFSKSISKQMNNNLANKSEAGRNKLILWILLPAISTLMLMSTTNLLTQSIASVPFLWLLPLSLYLLSFIICFGKRKWYSRNFYVYISLIAGLLSVASMFGNMVSVWGGIVIYGLALFSACMLCHGELYGIRPSSRQLDLFYLFIALGSAISGIIVGVIAPLFFKGIWETYIGFYFTFLLTIGVVIYYKDSFLYKRIRYLASSDKEAYIFSIIVFPTVIILTPMIINISSGGSPITVKTWRNFYGVFSVSHKSAGNISMTVLKSGNVEHGSQLSGGLQYEPTAYYGKKSGIGITILNHPRYGRGLNLGVIGLGAGTLAAYGKKGDRITFYEINPQVVKIANSEFTYLKNSKARVGTVLGDGRLSLEKEAREKKEKYDILAIDAFSDDSIPLHLLTKEAFGIYLERINRKDGFIALHISNNYIDLRPVVVQAAKYYKLQYAFIFESSIAFYDYGSDWALLSYDRKFFEKLIISRVKDGNKYKEISLWTDNYSNLFQVLK